MSRLWTESGLRVCLLDDSATFIDVRGGFSPVVTQIQRMAFAPGDWSRALIAFAEGLQMASPSSAIHVVLGAQWVRYLMLPWSSELVRRSFREALAVALFERQYKLPAAAFQMLQGPCNFGQPVLTAHIGQDVVPAMTSLVQARGLRMRSLRPLMTAVWDCHHATLRQLGGTMVIHESSRLLCVRHSRGYVQSVSIRPGGAPDLASFTASCEGAVQVVAADVMPMPPNVYSLQPTLMRHATSGMTVPNLAYYGVA